MATVHTFQCKQCGLAVWLGKVKPDQQGWEVCGTAMVALPFVGGFTPWGTFILRFHPFPHPDKQCDHINFGHFYACEQMEQSGIACSSMPKFNFIVLVVARLLQTWQEKLFLISGSLFPSFLGHVTVSCVGVLLQVLVVLTPFKGCAGAFRGTLGCCCLACCLHVR